MASEFVFVGCKMPGGVVLNLDTYEVISKEHGLVRRQDGARVALKGNAVGFGKPDISIDGYVFTRIDREFWDKWLATHADSSLIKDGLIKAAKSEADRKPMAREMAAEPGQFDRLNAEPGRDPRTRGLKVAKYDPDDERAAA